MEKVGEKKNNNRISGVLSAKIFVVENFWRRNVSKSETSLCVCWKTKIEHRSREFFRSVSIFKGRLESRGAEFRKK